MTLITWPPGFCQISVINNINFYSFCTCKSLLHVCRRIHVYVTKYRAIKCSLHLQIRNKLVTFGRNIRAINYISCSPVTSRDYQNSSAVAGVMGYGPHWQPWYTCIYLHYMYCTCQNIRITASYRLVTSPLKHVSNSHT